MTDWLSEATWKWTRFDYYHKHYAGRQIPEQELADDMFEALDDAYEGIDRMAPVLRELAEKLDACMNITGVVPSLSDDAKELLK